MSVAASGLLIFLSFAAAHAGSVGNPNVYKLDLSIEKSGEKVANPKFTVAFGSPAVVTVTDPKKNDGAYRIQATATLGEKSPTGKGTVRLDIVVLEQISGAWVIVGEPSIMAYEGQSASLDVSGPVGSFKISATATPEFNQKALNFKGASCPALTAPMAKKTPPPIVGIRNDPNCCSTGCADGSGQTMTCCGAIECCACGSCCRPPGGG
ncbi:MAG: hypothetical protein ACK8QZ_11095 [Anaerolineales bacterium]